jgi:hypothetical protein
MISLGRRAHAWWALQIARLDEWMPHNVIDFVKNVYEYEVLQQADVPVDNEPWYFSFSIQY